MNPLRRSRIAAAAMTELIKHLGLGNLARRYDGDNPAHWLVVDSQEIRCIDRGHVIAYLYTPTEDQVTIVVPDAYGLIRPTHMSEFNPAEKGIHIKNIPDFKGDTPPDLIATLATPQAPDNNAPRRPLPPYTTIRKPRYNGSL